MTDLSRRRFLQVTSAAAAAAVGPVWLRLGSAHASETAAVAGRKLVVMYLGGGNDGLNTVIPYLNSDYQRRRLTVSYRPDQVLLLPDSLEYGLHPRLPALQGLYTQGKAAIVHGVGYPGQDLSHFTSMDVWFSGHLDRQSSTGWLGRWLDATPDDGRAVRAVSIGYALAPMLVGELDSGVAVPSYGGFAFADGVDLDPMSEPFRRHEAFLRSCTNAVVGSAANAYQRSAIRTVGAVRAVNQLGNTEAPAPATFAEQMGFAIELLNSSLGVELAYLTPPVGFDDHAGEQTSQPDHLGLVDEAIARFAADVSALPDADDYLLMIFSEFGRRPEENASAGTDHGTAAPVLLVGNAVRGGLYGEHPSLADAALDRNGNLVPTVDFRDIYAELLDRWLVGPSANELLGYTPAAPVGFL